NFATSLVTSFAIEHLSHENMRTPVVVEMLKSLFQAGFVEIAGDDDGVAAGPLRFRSGRSADEGEPLAVRRPCESFSGQRQGAVRAEKRRVQGLPIGPIRSRDHQRRCLAVTSLVSDPAA